MPIGTASNRLRKMILFSMAKKLNLTLCYRCNREIKDIKNFSIEHKIAWLDSHNPIELFFDLDNIAFSHLSCNIKMAKKNNVPHGVSVKSSKLSNEDVKEIYKLSNKKAKTQKSIAKQFGISERLVRYIKNKQRWKHIFR